MTREEAAQICQSVKFILENKIIKLSTVTAFILYKIIYFLFINLFIYYCKIFIKYKYTTSENLFIIFSNIIATPLINKNHFII